ncbi:2-hydroxyacid dehydrogenase [Mesorhizobium sp. YR577]|uniref:2-hydroxyacid dehydrogenase n=1 Tax=Mesorhizobium sp. YR577 TaxID=1884373 RepID=UPI0008EA85AC|nr:2-hydroxyacid dehydrogenase [Mesorhizobium sp. YR577]SFU07200.1 Lactate dehydrogenase [Mesorhizobium sp. YR577]
MTDLSAITILVPGKLHPRSVSRIGEAFRLVRLDKIDPVLITDELKQTVRGVAASPSLGDNSVSAAFMQALPKLEIVANFGVGYDGVDAAHAGKHGVMVTNTPDVLTEEVADTAIGLLINTVRELPRAEAWLRGGRWVKDGNYPLSRLTLRGRKAGIFGMGRIGLAIAKRLEAFGMTVAYHNRRHVDGLAYEYHETLVGLAGAVDTLISVAPGTASTQKAVNAAVLKALGPDGVFVNIGRGSTVDEEALAAALGNGTIAAAGLDVFADEPNVPQALLDLSNATLLPHVGSASVHTRDGMADLVVDNLIAWFGKGAALTPVPETANVKVKG